MKRNVIVILGSTLAWTAACSSSDGVDLSRLLSVNAHSAPDGDGGASNTTSDALVGNGIKDGKETDVDCGGGSAPPCGDGQACVAGADCASVVCDAERCAAPTRTDGVKNGVETDVDCGGAGPDASVCDVGKECKVHSDCSSGACSYAGRCVAPSEKSCTRHEGGDTCGPNGNESCCTALPVPTAGGVLLDKYVITAGRMRTFVEATNGQIRQWMTANAPSWWRSADNKYLPTQLDAGAAGYDGVYQQLGADVYGKSGPTNEACWIGTGKDQIGARTYWLPQEANDANGSVQLYDQADLDTRALNCVTAYMVAAFCAWDGGRLPSRNELDKAWGSKKYPWGDAPAPAGWFDVPLTQPDLVPGTSLWTSGTTELGQPGTCTYTGEANTPCDPFHANFVYNYWGGKTRNGNDYSIYIAPPGRFPLGNGPYGHADLSGALFTYTTISSSGYDEWSKSGSFQGHDIPWTTYPSISFLTAPATYKYWATGGRCAR